MGRDFSEMIAPVIVSALFMMIPIIAILTSHQRKMAMIMRQEPKPPLPTEMADASLREEVQELKQMVNQQTIVLDNLSRSTEALAKRLGADESLAERIAQ